MLVFCWFIKLVLIKTQSSQLLFCMIYQTCLINTQSSQLLFCWYITKSATDTIGHVACLMIYQQNCTWALCVVDDISTKSTKPFWGVNDISTKKSKQPICVCRFCWYIVLKTQKVFVVFVDISSKAQSGHLQFCWYIINNAKCPIVSFAFLMIYQQKSNWRLCLFYQNSLVYHQQHNHQPS